MKHYIILLSAVTILLTGCTRLSKLESHGGSSVKQTGIELKPIKLTTGKGKHSTKTNDTVTDTVTDTTPVDTSKEPVSTKPEVPQDNTTPPNQLSSGNIKDFDPFSGLYGPGT